MSVDHAVTRTVRDSAALLDISQGPDPGAPYYPPPPERPYIQEVTRPPGTLNIAVSTESMLSDKMHPHCIRAVEKTAELLEELGHRITVARPTINGAHFKEAMSVMIAADMASTMADSAREAGRRPSEDQFEASSWLAGLVGRRLTAGALVTALQYLRNMGRTTAPFFEEYDVFLEPTIARPPWKSGALEATTGKLRLMSVKRFPRRRAVVRTMRALGEPVLDAIPNTPLWNATGQPSMSMPLHWADGLPIGVQFTARYADEALLFRLAAQLEKARPWVDRLPPILTRG